MMRLASLQGRDVISIYDGTRIGAVEDLLFDEEHGQIVSLIVLGPFCLRTLFRRQREYEIPWGEIRRVGRDAVLVSYQVPVSADTPYSFLRNLFSSQIWERK